MIFGYLNILLLFSPNLAENISWYHKIQILINIYYIGAIFKLQIINRVFNYIKNVFEASKTQYSKIDLTLDEIRSPFFHTCNYVYFNKQLANALHFQYLKNAYFSIDFRFWKKIKETISVFPQPTMCLL